MLCQFSFWNYKSYRDEATLDLCPAKISEHEEHLIEEPITKEKFLPLAVIYGPNGGGKTAVLDAFQYLRRKIIRKDEASEPSGELDTKIVIPGKKVHHDKAISFAFDPEYAKRPTGWSVSFITDGYEYKYTLALLAERIVEESLFAKDLKTGDVQMLFERGEMGESIVLGNALAGIQVDKVKDSTSLLSFIEAVYE